MSKKVIGAELGIPHYAARCRDCDWTILDYHRRQTGIARIRKHVTETGHKVRVERRVVTEYGVEVTP